MANNKNTTKNAAKNGEKNNKKTNGKKFPNWPTFGYPKPCGF